MERINPRSSSIQKVSCQISRKLWDEIKQAQKNLNSIEHQKCIGRKKKNYNFIETSDKIGKLLCSQRSQKKQMTSVLEDWF